MRSIYSYTDYREFLRDAFSSKRDRNRSFTLRAIAGHLGIGSGTLNRILNGSRNIGPSLLPTIATFLGLKTRESEYLGLMIKFARTDNPGKKRNWYEKILEKRGEIRYLLQEEQYQLFEEWYYLALHQLLRFAPHYSDPDKLGAMLDPPVSGSRIRKAIALLEKNRLIRTNDLGGYSPTDVSMTTGETWRGMAIHGFQKTAAQMAALALDKFPKEERDFSTLTISLSAKNFSAAREIFFKARQDLLKLDEKEDAPERVFQANFQLFPLSRHNTNDRGGE
jgi:uncharacterized protein (TIGR02147 family)